MAYVIKTIGILMAVFGVVMSTAPALMTRLMELVKVGKRLYAIGVLRILIGGLLIFASTGATVAWIPAAIGAIIVISGALIFALGLQRDVAMIDWILAKPENTRRAGAIVAAVLGVLLIYGA